MAAVMKLYGLTAIELHFLRGKRNPSKHPPALNVLPIVAAIRCIGNTALADLGFAFICGLTSAVFCEGG